MRTLQIGRTEIPYQLRRSADASERRITVSPEGVQVVALAGDTDETVLGFLDRKRQWLFNTVREMERISATRHVMPRLMTGSKVLYRGRRMPLTVRRSDGERIEITYRNGFLVDLPAWVTGDADHLVASELKLWLKQRARRDAKRIAASYARRFGPEPRSIRVADMKGAWGSCGRDGNILINWHLIFAPSKVLEYVVVHELAHLLERSHGERFLALLAGMMPEHRAAAVWLEHHQASLSADFLDMV